MIRRYVYAGFCARKNQIKIGCSVAPKLRVKELGTRRVPVKLLAMIPGDFFREGKYHHRLAGFRIRRYSPEWFRVCPEVLLVISEIMFIERALKNGYPEGTLIQNRLGRKAAA